MFSASLLKPVERLINRGIDQSGEATTLCRELDGRSMVVRLEVQPLKVPLTFRVIASDLQICITGNPDEGADVEMAGTLLELNRLMFSNAQLPLRDGRVRIKGETEIAEQFRTLLFLARPRLEEDLSELVGDDLGHQLATAFKNLRRFAIDTLEEIGEQASEYLQEDTGTLPARSDTEKFFNEVDELANDLARIEARLSRIRINLEGDSHNGNRTP